jgi:long-chain acyl-CoA synthetase
MNEQFKKITGKVKEGIEELHYNYYKSAPWFKLYDKYTPRNLEVPDCTMYELIKHVASLYPDYYAYEYYGKKCIYREFMEKIDRTANALINIGVKQGDFVSICMPNTPEAIIAFYAINEIGAVANMIHPLSSETEIEYYLTETKSKYLFTMDFTYNKIVNIDMKLNLTNIIICKANDGMNFVTSTVYYIASGHKIKIKNKLDKVLMWKDFFYLGRESHNNIVKGKGKDLAVILYSGGTTGDPKGIMLSNISFNAIAYQNREACKNAVAGQSLLALMPIFHGFGLGICFHTALSAGMKCIILPKFSKEEFAKIIKTYKPNFIVGVPTLYEALVNTELKENDLECVHVALCGGDSLTPILRKQINECFKEHGSNTEVMVGYGMTECCASVIYTPLNHFKDGSIGIPEPNNYVMICEPNTIKNLFYDEDGEICVSGPSVMLGYLNNPEETRMVLKKHDDGRIWLHTGDVGSMDKNGVVYFKTRLKRMIISAGYNVYPSYIENIINQHPSVLTSVVVGVPDEYRGEVAKAFIVLKPDVKQTPELDAEIRAYCKKHIAKYSLPVAYEYRDDLPKTKINKVDYRKLQ